MKNDYERPWAQVADGSDRRRKNPGAAEVLGAARWQVMVSGILLLILTACQPQSNDHFQGYVEGEYVQVAAPRGGQLDRLLTVRGAQVESGAPLFVLDAREEAAATAEAQQQLAQAEKRLADLGKGGRSSELAALTAAFDQARSSRELASQEWTRRIDLQREGLVTTEDYERARSSYERATAVAAQREAELATARLGARSDQQQAAAAEVGAARARLDRAQWALTQKSQTAPAAGLIFDTLFEVGEYVPAGRPVVTLLPPGNVKIRFFVPEPVLGTLRVGQQIKVAIDGVGTLSATIDYLSPRAEYTPPIIYSRETRAKLVFLAEARPAPAEAGRLHPGQPVEVRIGEHQ